jgi:flagellar secretion chaperone FliS
MNDTIRDAYLETQVNTATPQRLRLMLIEEALRRIRVAQTAYETEQFADGVAAVGHAREIVAELIGGIHPDETPEAKQVLGIYLFLFSALAEAQFSRDGQRLIEVIRVLDEERQTWQTVCEQMPDRPVAANTSAASEEVAPQRVPSAFRGGYEQTAAAPARTEASVTLFSIEA